MTGPIGETTQTTQTGPADGPAREAPQTDGRQPCAA